MTTKQTTQTALLIFGTLLLLVSLTASAEAQDFSGEWNAVTGDRRTVLFTLQQTGAEVRGQYGQSYRDTGIHKPLNGSPNEFVKVSTFAAEPVLQAIDSVTGTINGNGMRFTWGQNDRRGSGRVTLSSDGESFQGTFSWGGDPDNTSGGTLTGRRRHSFAGVWQGKMGDGGLQLILQQTNGQVTGQVRVNSADLGIIQAGYVVGNRFRFQIVRPAKMLTNGRSMPEEYVGVGELGMNAGGKSFYGQIMGASVSGTFLGR